MQESLSLSELNQLIQLALNEQLEPTYWVVAEIGEMKRNHKGHCYMDLVEKEEEKIIAKARATIWSYEFYNISRWFESITRQELQEGMKILAKVVVQYHQVFGLSLNIKDIDPQYTLGERARRKQEVINQLLEEGVFDMNKEADMPFFPQRVAIISSPTAAGYGDFMDQLHHNPYGYKFHTKLFRATLQGDRAADSILEAIHLVHESLDDFDCLLILRGGGAQVDLDCFDTYQIAAHTAQFPIPVITGIGHERDETITDMVAHTAVKTPTAAAEYLLGKAMAVDEQLNQLTDRIQGSSKQIIQDHWNLIDKLTDRLNYGVRHEIQKEIHRTEKLGQNLQHSSRQLLQKEENTNTQLKHRLIYSSRNLIRESGQKLGELEKHLNTHSLLFLNQQKHQLEKLQQQLQLLDPINVLRRGYSITTLNGKILREVEEIRSGDELMTKTDIQLIKSIVKEAEKAIND
ncbi:exodeoxyribonuclease VII large subunit [Xanthovirga aplysinae]|uniref:exodeoxyribonuclease VII large subunit n=1 Tax=Xanthovirga aplysinae TaxID=2529853 RepID=UPI0012BD53FF|nr:exodeoxyribonuclease VII large subunit [Xanthovirga aplysinae]MTI32358.1 exodeoxyribonuclease VII large subunit [Xanthovirga aplysinae]